MLLEGEACVLLIETQVVLGARLALPGPGRGTEGGWAAGPGLPALRGPGGGGGGGMLLWPRGWATGWGFQIHF